MFHSLAMLSSSVAYAAASNGVIVRTNNGGASFTVEQSFTLTSTLYCLAMYRGTSTLGLLPGQRGVAADNAGGIYAKGFAPSAAPTGYHHHPHLYCSLP